VALLTLADASALAERGRKKAPTVVPVSRRLVRDLLREPASASPTVGELAPQRRLHDVARQLERAHYQQLFEACGGSFEAMAGRLLGRADVANARKVRLRYNQLGLRVRAKKS
jgi:hypothetical protein